jgi:chemotaxis protein methyltransferase CheR
MTTLTISDQEFRQFQTFIHQVAGISLSPAKKALICGRLGNRIQKQGMDSYADYFRLITSGAAQSEMQVAVDLLTTNETYFFREPKHFDLLRQHAEAARGRGEPFRVWSAASSSGEEAYSIAMVLADVLDERPWEIVGSDISTRVLERARTGHYVDMRARNIPVDYLKRFCLKGTGSQAGTVLVSKALRSRVSFAQVNLNEPLPALGKFDVVFLRNVMIYFNNETKRQVVARVLETIRPGGYFLIGHSESLNDITTKVEQVAPSSYRKP